MKAKGVSYLCVCVCVCLCAGAILSYICGSVCVTVRFPPPFF